MLATTLFPWVSQISEEAWSPGVWQQEEWEVGRVWGVVPVVTGRVWEVWEEWVVEVGLVPLGMEKSLIEEAGFPLSVVLFVVVVGR
jgi:hypothetical protein